MHKEFKLKEQMDEVIHLYSQPCEVFRRGKIKKPRKTGAFKSYRESDYSATTSNFTTAVTSLWSFTFAS
jgi:hypothetical protein